MLKLRNLTMRFGSTLAVDGVSLDIPQGQMVGVIGRSGAGKSTLLRLVNRLIDPSAGGIESDGQDVRALQGAALRRWRACCAMVFQQFNLVGRLDVVTNVLVGRLAYRSVLPSLIKRFSAAERAMAVHALDRLDMAQFALRRAETLSGGQQQRVAIARALVQEPHVLLADEPVASLDPRSAMQVMEALRRICAEDGVTVVCNLHHLEYARSYCGRVVGMSQGRVVFDGRPEHLSEAAVSAIYDSACPARQYREGGHGPEGGRPSQPSSPAFLADAAGTAC